LKERRCSLVNSAGLADLLARQLQRHGQKAEPEHECQPAETVRRERCALTDRSARKQREQPQPGQQVQAPLRRICDEQAIPQEGQPERCTDPGHDATMAWGHSTLALF